MVQNARFLYQLPPLLFHHVGHELTHLIALSREGNPLLSGGLMMQQRNLFGTRHLGYGKLVLDTVGRFLRTGTTVGSSGVWSSTACATTVS